MKFRRYKNRLRVCTTVDGVLVQEYIPIENDDLEAAQKKAEKRYYQLRAESACVSASKLLEPKQTSSGAKYKPWLIAPNFSCQISHRKSHKGKMTDISPEIYIRYRNDAGEPMSKRIRLLSNGGLKSAFKMAVNFYTDVYQLNADQKHTLMQRIPPASLFYELLLDQWVKKHGDLPRIRQKIIDATLGIRSR